MLIIRSAQIHEFPSQKSVNKKQFVIDVDLEDILHTIVNCSAGKCWRRRMSVRVVVDG